MTTDETPRRPGRPGVRDVAERAGVGIASVSRVLAGRGEVSEVMRHRVLDAAASLGYEPDIAAQSLRTGSSKAIGFVVPDISNPLFAEIALGAEVALHDAGFTMLLVNSMSDHDLELRNLALMARRRVDGVLLSLADESNDGVPASLRTLGAPTVLIDRELRGVDDIGAVLSDHAHGITDAMRHLAELGHRSVALINGSAAVRPSRERAAAVRRSAKIHDIAVTVRSGAFTAEHGFVAARALLSATPRPSALVVGGNQILVGVLRAIRDLGLRIPSDVSLVTCDETPLIEFTDPPLDVIARDPGELGRRGAQLLLARLAGQRPDPVLLPTRYRRRSSTSAPGPGSPSASR